MKYTNKQLLERENLEWFCKDLFRRSPPKEGDFDEYLAYSERGVVPEGMSDHHVTNFYIAAKRMRGITIHELWEESFFAQDGSWPGIYWLVREEDGTLIPEHIKDYIKHEFLKGSMAKIFDKEYANELQ